jgi:hypothetical protein
MSGFNKRGSTGVAAKTAFGPVRTTGEVTKTFEGGAAFKRDAKSDLFMLAVTYMGEDRFYEKKDASAKRLVDLARKVAVDDPDWLARFIPWLRNEANMRTASIVIAAEAVKARVDAKLEGSRRGLIDTACQRADEPGELLAYWTGTYGRNRIPIGVKRGVGDAVRRLYNEYSYAKYDSDSKGVRFSDVIELVHPVDRHNGATVDEPQGDLFERILDERHGREKPIPESLAMLRARKELMSVPVKERRAVVLSGGGQERLKAAGITWEALSGWLQGPMDKAAWEAVIPSMGYMALLRNLRNFDEAGINEKSYQYVAKRISDPAQVAKSKQFPYRFLSAYRSLNSLRWAHALESALGAACSNIPDLPGRTLVLVDTSGSMLSAVSAKSQVRHVDIGALIGLAIAFKCGPANVDLIGFANGVFQHPITRGGSVLREIESFCARIGSVGHGTETVSALKASYSGQDRVVIVSDMQAFHYPGSTVGYYDVMGRTRGMSVSEAIPERVPMFGINTAGYGASSIDTSKPGRAEIGGFSDKVFTMLASLSAGDGDWPF